MCEKENIRYLHLYGYTEWLEIRDAIQHSKSKFKKDVEDVLNKLLQRMSQISEVPFPPGSAKKKRKRSGSSSGKNEHETKFDIDSLLAHLEIPNISMLNVVKPEGVTLEEGDIVREPKVGMAFMNNNGLIKFFQKL